MESGPIIETTIRVRYAETDAMGVVYHTNYFVWFEVGRGAYFRERGMGYDGWERQSIYFPVSELHGRFLAPARYGDLVRVRTWVQELRSRGTTFAYEALMDETGQRLATGWTKHLCVDGDGRVVVIPPRLRALLSPT
jgi:acyl-CoA thioester hydrolase